METPEAVVMGVMPVSVEPFVGLGIQPCVFEAGLTVTATCAAALLVPSLALN